MIRLVCTQCKNVLTIDDAFAGGVCRCQHCGTIQTVPARGAGDALIGTPVGSPASLVGGNRSLFQRDAPAAGTGLDDLANIVVSSGLSSGRLTRGNGTRGNGPARPRPNLVPLFAAAGVLIVGLLAVIAYLATRPPAAVPGAPSSDNGSTAGRHPTPSRTQIAPTGPVEPTFCGTPVGGSTVIYLLDRGEATKDLVPALSDAALKSAESLGADRKFEILFWTIDADTPAYPESETTYASRESVAAARQSFADVPAFGNTDVFPALAVALARHPNTILLATGKEFGLDDAWVAKVLDARGSAAVRIDTFSLGNHGEIAALRDLAAKTGGSYHDVGQTALTDAGR